LKLKGFYGHPLQYVYGQVSSMLRDEFILIN
jgi:hypothetical protein